MNVRAVILATDGLSARAVYHGLKNDCSISRVVLEDPIPRLAFMRNRARTLGFATVIGQAFFQALIAPILRASGRRRQEEIVTAFGMCVDPIPEGIIKRVRSVNAAESIEDVVGLAPQVGIVSGTRILSRQLIASVGCPLINWHAGITPLYRGVHGGYWALSRGDLQHCGVTVHLIDAGIDTGPILFQAPIQPSRDDNFTTYPALQLAAAIPLLRKAVADVAAGRLEPIAAPAGESRLWSHPTIWQYLRLRGRGVK